nr:hypothetical protein Iba_chr01dCG14980 [Ipomoea batatas]
MRLGQSSCWARTPHLMMRVMTVAAVYVAVAGGENSGGAVLSVGQYQQYDKRQSSNPKAFTVKEVRQMRKLGLEVFEELRQCEHLKMSTQPFSLTVA